MNSELWHACAGPLVSLPQPGNLVYYFPQGHSEQVILYFSFLKIALFRINIYFKQGEGSLTILTIVKNKV